MGFYGPGTIRWATREEMRSWGLRDAPLVHIDESGEADCYFTTTKAVVIRPEDLLQH